MTTKATMTTAQAKAEAERWERYGSTGMLKALSLGFWSPCQAKGCTRKAACYFDRVSPTTGKRYCAEHKAQAKAPDGAPARMPGYYQDRWGDRTPKARDRSTAQAKRARLGRHLTGLSPAEVEAEILAFHKRT